MINVITTDKELNGLYYENTAVGFFTFEHSNKPMKYQESYYFDQTLDNLFETWSKDDKL